MNREETIEAIKVMQAFVDGAEIEVKLRHLDESVWAASEPNWSWMTCDYRIKPKPFECWTVVDAYGDIANFGNAKAANECCANRNKHGSFGPYTVKHMREVME